MTAHGRGFCESTREKNAERRRSVERETIGGRRHNLGPRGVIKTIRLAITLPARDLPLDKRCA